MTAPFRHILFTGAFVAALAACQKQEQPKMPPPEVAVLQASSQTVPLTRDVVGRLSPFRSADVRARVPGVLLKRLYREGSDVREGQILFQIDPAPLQATLNAAQAQLAQAQAAYVNAKTAADRARQLAPQKYVSQNDLDSAVALERTSAAAVQAASAEVTAARINLDYTSVRAPIGGRAGKQRVTEGALVGQTDITLLTTIDQIDSLYVNFSVAAEELAQLRSAQSSGSLDLAGTGQATIQIILGDGTAFNQVGTLDFSDATVDPATGSVSLRALLPNPDKILLPGSFVTIRANLGNRNNVFVIPQAAIQRDTKGAYAMVVGADGNVVRKNVIADNQQDGKWLITSGLAEGDRIIVSGLQKVKEGEPAAAVKWDPNAPAPGAAAPGGAPAQAAAAPQQETAKPEDAAPAQPATPAAQPEAAADNADATAAPGSEDATEPPAAAPQQQQ
ncbi:MAG: efflux RND transporter periplasmic adaptor subunit [Xanthomonadaceae bacterium]|jgi:membrane fusion protein (multidrug efflux system)|nr:efflux RND transporter periplasmic adaptor subunit [Xanthomonadaceae bacterium]